MRLSQRPALWPPGLLLLPGLALGLQGFQGQASDPSGCPFASAARPAASQSSRTNRDWWPNQLNLNILRRPASPLGEDFDYAEEFGKLDFAGLKRELRRVVAESQDWWPADYGTYGGLFVRLAWHSAGTYRAADGRGGAGGGNQRFAPLNSWPDNGNLDKARRLLWPTKQKYGNAISWADLIVLAGNVALESMGFRPLGFAAGREDVWAPEVDTWWGSEEEMLSDKPGRPDRPRFTQQDHCLVPPLSSAEMGLIYVNPEGPEGKPDPLAAAKDARQTFARMGMNDEETVALTAGGHTFGKHHGAAPTAELGPDPEAAGLDAQGLGWLDERANFRGPITSGLEGAWTPTPMLWDNSYLRVLFDYDWTKTKSPAGAWQWEPRGLRNEDMAPDARNASIRVPIVMNTVDMALRMDPDYRRISQRFRQNHSALTNAFAKSWFKLTHRDVGPRDRYLGPEVPREDFAWQDPLPKAGDSDLTTEDIDILKSKVLDSGVSPADLAFVAWASAATFRRSDKRGGANGARICLSPMKDWPANDPPRLARVLRALKDVREEYSDMGISMADLIVLAGTAAVERAAEDAGVTLTVPFVAGRTDATEAQTDAENLAVLQPPADPFTNYFPDGAFAEKGDRLLVDKASLLGLTPEEMTVLAGGLRSMGVQHSSSQSRLGESSGRLSNGFFTALLDMDLAWRPARPGYFEGRSRRSPNRRPYVGTRADLVFGSNAELRALAELYAQQEAQQRFADDFAKAWFKLMHNDRFDSTMKRWRREHSGVGAFASNALLTTLALLVSSLYL